MHVKIEEKHRKLLSKYKFIKMSRFGEETDGREMICVVPTDSDKEFGIMYTYKTIDSLINNEHKLFVFYLSWRNEIHERVVVPYE